MKDYCERYNFIKDFSENLIRQLALDEFTNLDISENLLYKIAGYNVGLEGFIKLLNSKEKKRLFLKAPLLNKWIISFVFDKPKKYEITLNNLNKTFKQPKEKYDQIFFATMNNYLNPLVESIKSKKRSILIIPEESENWINYKKIVENDINFTFLDTIQFDEDKVEEIKDKIKKRYLEKRREILFFKYNLAFIEPLLTKFLFNYVPKHIVIINKLEKYMMNISHKKTQFYVARERRGLENAFVQVANKISGNTNMLIHGMISFDFDKRLWTEGRFKNCKNVYVWGEHDKEVIEKRQELLKEKTPNIVISGNNFLKKISKTNNGNILFICQSFTNRYIPFFSKNSSQDHKMIVRLHPGEKDKIHKYKKYERQNFLIDDLENDLALTLAKASLIISHSSTAMLEAIYNQIPTLILNFNELKKIPNIFKENQIDENKFEAIVLNETNYKYKIDKIFDDETYKQEVIAINKKIFNYFCKDGENV
jgi:hypothetical protein